MLSERQLQELLKVFEQRMQGVTDDYIRRMGAHLKDIGTLTDTDIHRLKQLKRVNANIEAIKRQMARAAEASVEDIEKVFRAVAESDSEFAREMFAENHTPGVKADRIKTLSSPIERILKAQLRVTAQEMANLSRTTVIADTYKAAVDVAVQTVQSGITDYQSAIRSALKKAAADGLRVEYQSGYTRRLDSAIRQNVLDGVRALNRDVLEQLGKEYGADGVEISAHALCAEDHLPYQGRQFSNKEFDRLQNMLDRPFGLWNCKHTIYPIILGVSPPAHSPEELQMYRTNSREQITIDGITMSRYEWSQQQRRMETAVREQKSIANGAKAAGDDLLRREAQRNINRLQAQYAKISDAAGLYQQPERMSVAGFRKVKTAEELTANIVAASPRFLQKSDVLYKNAQHIKPIAGYEDVVVHSDKYGFIFMDADGNESNVSVAEFANILKQSDVYHGGNIRLVACESAADGAITAQALADILRVEILAPSDVVYVDPEGNMTIGNPLTNDGEWIKIRPRELR